MHQETTEEIENENRNFSNGNSKALKLHFKSWYSFTYTFWSRCDWDLINIKNYQCKLMLLMFLASAMTELLYM